jgi:hypothetical protein
LRRNKRLATVFVGVQELLFRPNNHNTINNNNNAIIPDVLLGHILTAAMEDFERDKSVLFLLIRHAIVGQEDACPLHEKIVDFLRDR